MGAKNGRGTYLHDIQMYAKNEELNPAVHKLFACDVSLHTVKLYCQDIVRCYSIRDLKTLVMKCRTHSKLIKKWCVL